MANQIDGYEPKSGEIEKTTLARLEKKLDELGSAWEEARVSEYVDMMKRPGKLLYMNFLMGISRGFGMAVGFTILTAIVLWMLQKIVLLNLPFLSNLIADLVKMVQDQMSISPTGTNF